MPRAFLSAVLLALPLPAAAQHQTNPHREFAGVRGPIRGVSFSPDGKYVAAGPFSDPSARVWDVATGKAADELSAGPSFVAEFAPDGKSMLTTNRYGDGLSLWAMPGGKRLRTLKTNGRNGAHHAAYSPTGKHVAATGEELRVWDVGTGKLLYAKPARSGCTVAFSPDGKALASCDHSGDLTLWDVESGKQLRTWMPGGILTGLAFSRDGVRVYCSGTDSRVREYDAKGGGGKLREWHVGKVGVARTLSLSPDGRSLALSTEAGVAQVWELSTLRLRRSVRADTGWAWGVAYAPDGRSIATGGDQGVVRLWDLTAGWSAPDAERKRPPTPKQLDAWWNDLGGEADAAFTAVWALAAHGKQSVPFLAEKLKGVENPPDVKGIARLVEQLDADEFDDREAATKALLKAGAAARPALARALRDPASLEQKRRSAKILERLLASGLSHGEVVRSRVAEALERIDTAEARKVRGTIGE